MESVADKTIICPTCFHARIINHLGFRISQTWIEGRLARESVESPDTHGK